MKRPSWLLLVGIGFSVVAHAGNIYKCSGGGRDVAYQNFPCAQGQQEILMGSSAQPAYTQTQNVKLASYGASPQSPAPVSAQETRPNMPFQRTALTLGMTDDEVLNLPHWGLPLKILRSKANRIWREEWVYGSKRLYFENTRLTAIGDEPSPFQQVASLTVR